ncbi:hypothetical protein ZOSMA_5802G00010 [Zostera marina]|uniref:VWFA domain-containing protein n=1 Tax=Zostera marina TaxID=29655 RepID=A0A0K9NXM1_ZOSMR|nr:hypothetical protein ZOSMA_5802G00010 [Zostera marina]
MIASFVLVACSPSSGQYAFNLPDGQTTVGAAHQTKHLITSQHTQAKIAINAPPHKIKAAVDILLLFDRTRSMKNVIRTTANAATDIVEDIQSNVPDTRFSVATVGDYSPLFTDSADKRTWLLNTDFTFSAKEIEKAAHNISLTSGGDLPEAYSRGLYEASELNWRKGAKKIVIFFGDSIDHPIDPGRDEILGTADDLNMQQVLAILKAKKITVIGIRTVNDPSVVNQFNRISSITGGKSVSLDKASASSEVIIASIKNTLAKPAVLIAQGRFSPWVTTKLMPSKQKQRTLYNIDIKVPDNTPIGVYNIPLKFYSATPNDALVNALRNSPIDIKIITGWYNHPIVLWLPILLLLTYLAWTGLAMIRGGYKRSISVTSKAKYDTNRYTPSYLALDILAMVSILSTAVAIYLCVNQLVLSEIL